MTTWTKRARRGTLVAASIVAAALAWPTVATALDAWHTYQPSFYFDPSISYAGTGYAQRKANQMYNTNGSYTPVKVWQVDSGGATLAGSVVTSWGSAQWGIAGSYYYTQSRCKVPTPYAGYAECRSYRLY